MASLFPIQHSVGLLLMVVFQSASGVTITNVTLMRFAGSLSLFAVPRERVAAKLRELKSQNPSAPGLNLPNRPVFPEFLRDDQHVVGVSIGNLEASSFIDTLPSCVSDQYTLRTPTVQFFIPMLTGPDPYGPPQFKLVLNSFVSTDKPFLQPHTAVPTTQVEELVFKENGGVTLKDGEEYFSVSWKEGETCETLNYLSSRDMDEFMYEFIFPYNYELNFSMCDTRDVMEVDLCKSHEELRCIFSQNRFNACEYWTVVGPYRNCKLETFTIEAISAKFQAESLLSQDDRIPIIADIQNDTYVGQHFKVPCIDK